MHELPKYFSSVCYMSIISPKCPFCGTRDVEKKGKSTFQNDFRGDSDGPVINPYIYAAISIAIIAGVRFGGAAIKNSMEQNNPGSGELLGMILIFLQVALFAVFLGIAPKITRNYNTHKKRFGKTWFCSGCGSHFKG